MKCPRSNLSEGISDPAATPRRLSGRGRAILQRSRNRWWSVIFGAAAALGVTGFLPQAVHSQPVVGSASAVRTEIQMEILLPSGVTGLAAQRWGQVLSDQGLSARFRQPVLNDKPDVSESLRGRTRVVTVVGSLDREGSLNFPDRRYSLSQAGRLGEWIRELRTYGAQGSDAGQPGFGLSPAQFQTVFAVLEGPVPQNTLNLKLEAALQLFELPDSLPLRFTPAATEMKDSLLSTCTTEVRGMSRGTALAIVLNNAGLGYRPGRTPAGTLELRVVPLADSEAVWPVGWPLERAPLHAMPKLVEVVPVELKDVPLSDVLTAAARQTETRILIDTWYLREKQIQLDKVLVNQPLKKMTWSGLLDRATFPDTMRELLQDEAGKSFIWITTRTTAQLNARHKQQEARFENE